MAILEKRGRHVAHFFIFSSLWDFRPKKKKLGIFMSVNLHAGNGVGLLSACPNCISISTFSFAQPKIKLEGLSQK